MAQLRALLLVLVCWVLVFCPEAALVRAEAAHNPLRLLLSLDSLMSKAEQERTGVSRLSAQERTALEEWLTQFAASGAKVLRSTTAIPGSASYAGVGQKHWVQSVAQGGGWIQLEDGSLWQVSPIDKIHTAVWLPIEYVIVVKSGNPYYPYRLVGERDAAEAKLVTGSPSAAISVTRDGEVDLYGSAGRAVAYIAAGNDMTLYLWTGEPCAYLDDEDIYGFNGKHLGWFRSGLVYDHDGYVVAAVAESFASPVEIRPIKSLKQLRPLKSLKELKPLRPLFVQSWCPTPEKAFFLIGAE